MDATKLTVPGSAQGTDGEWVPGTAKLRVGCSPSALGPRQTQLTFSSDLPRQPQGAITVKVYGGESETDTDVSP